MSYGRKIFPRFSFSLLTACSALAVLSASPVSADTKKGVDAWQAGDYATAVAEWRESAAAGDADAAFNLGQAYKTGRGVPQDLNEALKWYGQAAQAGHIVAADNYGLTLYQLGRKSEAMPFIQASAARGEPRAQYVFGAELFNGKLVEKDWPRAYAMMNRASAQGLAPASRVLAEMDQHIPLDQRQQGLALSAQLERSEAQERSRQMGGFDMAAAPVSAPVRTPAPAPSKIETFELPPAPASGTPSAPAQTAGANYGYQPEYAALPEVKKVPADAIVQGESTEQDDDELEELPPANDYAIPPAPQPNYQPASTPSPVQAQPQPVYQPAPRPVAQPATSGVVKAADGLPAGYVPSVGPRTAPPKVASVPAPSPKAVATPSPKSSVATGTAWRVQLGAYDSLKIAEEKWYKMEAKYPALSGMQPYLVKFNGLIRLQYGPFASKAEADKSCASVKRAGQDCFVLKQQ